MLKRIAIDNYRCFTNFEFEPDRINLLLGRNGSGKSSFLDAISAVVAVVVNGEDAGVAFPTASLTRWDRRREQRVELEVLGEPGNYIYTLAILHDAERDRIVIRKESVTLDGRSLFSFEDGEVHLYRGDGSRGPSFEYRGKTSFLAQMEEGRDTKELMWLLEYLSGVWTVRLDARAMVATADGEDETIDEDGANFASWYRHLAQENPERLPALWSSLAKVVPGLQWLKLVTAGRARQLVAGMVTASSPYEVDFDELSDGQRALIALYTLLAGVNQDARCYFFDEPELHVGLSEIQPWLVELDERLIDKGQVFVVSHHPEVVDYMAAGHAFVFERPDGGPARVRPALFERNGGLPASVQVARGLFHGG